MAQDQAGAQAGQVEKGKVFWVLSDKLGDGDPELGTLLMQKYIYSLARAEQAPEKMIFMNGGIVLTGEGSPVLDDLRLLEQRGTAISTCGTCLDFHGVRDKLAVGAPGKMDGAAATTMAAKDVVVLR